MEYLNILARTSIVFCAGFFLASLSGFSKGIDDISVYIISAMRKGGDYEHIFFRAYRQNTVQCFDDDGY